MTAAQEAKSYGFKSLTQVAGIFGCTTETLRQYHKYRHQAFEIIMIGAITLTKGNENDD